MGIYAQCRRRQGELDTGGRGEEWYRLPSRMKSRVTVEIEYLVIKDCRPNYIVRLDRPSGISVSGVGCAWIAVDVSERGCVVWADATLKKEGVLDAGGRKMKT